MPGNIFHFAYSQYLNDTKNPNKQLDEEDKSNAYLNKNEIDKLNKIWVSRYEVIEKPQPVFSTILMFLKNETFMDIIN